MHVDQRKQAQDRGAKILVMTAIALPLLILPLLAITADMAVYMSARAQLMTVADAAALAGAQQLATEARVSGTTDLTTEMSAARTQAKAFAQANRVLNGVPVVLDNSSNATTGDTVIGYIDVSTPNPKSQFDTSAAKTLQYNSVQFAARRSSDHGGLLPAFFSALQGNSGTAIHVVSTATTQVYSISGFKVNNNLNAQVLPIAMAKTNYDQMLADSTSDQYTYNTTTKTVSSGPDGVYESLIFPITTGNAGNWGTVQIGVTDNSTSTLGSQILSGITPAQLATYPGGTLQLSSATNPPSLTLSGNPGISAALKDDLTSIIGRPLAVPLYDQSTGQGNTTSFRVVGFGAVRIVSVNFQGNPKYVIVQPALLNDGTAIAGSVQQSWTSGGLVRLFLSR